MKKKALRFPIGLRTLKTAAAVIVSMLLVDSFGTTTSRLIFAMLGAMAAVQPTFRESVESCMTQIIGTLFGAAVGVVLLALHLPGLVCTGIGIILVITMYNALGIRFSPSLPCLIVVTLCTAPEAHPLSYAAGRIWDTAIGLAVGMAINTLIFPYDNSRKIRQALESLDKELLRFLENLCDGDDNLPDARAMNRQIAAIAGQLTVFSNQRLLLHLSRQKHQLEVFRQCEGKARALVARMEVLSSMERPGILDDENRRLLGECGARVRDSRRLELLEENDVVMNYHIRQLLRLRRELMEALNSL